MTLPSKLARPSLSRGRTGNPASSAKHQAQSPAVASDGIGQKLRHRRKVRQLSLTEVSNQAGLSIGLLSQIERGLSTPTLRSLNQICQALEMPLRWLFDADEEEAAVGKESVVVRFANRRRMDLGANAGMVKEILSSDAIPQLQLIRLVIHPGGKSGMSPNQNSTGAKAGTVVSGQLALEIDGREYILNRGDSFSFMATSRYSFYCVGDTDCELFWAVTPALY